MRQWNKSKTKRKSKKTKRKDRNVLFLSMFFGPFFTPWRFSIQIQMVAWHVNNLENASHETLILRSVRQKTRRRTSILKLRSVKCKEVSREMLVLMLQHVLSRVSAFPVASPCLWGKLQTLSLCKTHLCWRSQNRLASRFAWQAQHFRRVVFPVFFSNRIVTAASKGRTEHCELYTLHSTLYTPHFTLRTLHFTLYTLHFTLHTWHSTLTFYTLHSTLYTPFLFCHNFDSGVRYHVCEHSGSWVSSCFSLEKPLPIQTTCISIHCLVLLRYGYVMRLSCPLET